MSSSSTVVLPLAQDPPTPLDAFAIAGAINDALLFQNDAADLVDRLFDRLSGIIQQQGGCSRLAADLLLADLKRGLLDEVEGRVLVQPHDLADAVIKDLGIEDDDDVA